MRGLPLLQSVPLPAVQAIPSPLTLSQTEPQTERVTITEGEAISFSAQAFGTAPLHYEWRLEGKPVSRERQWAYRPTPEEAGTTVKTVRVVVSDPHGQQVEKTWQVTVTAAALVNQPPRILTASSATNTVDLESGPTQTSSQARKIPRMGNCGMSGPLLAKRLARNHLFSCMRQKKGNLTYVYLYLTWADLR